MFKSVQRISNRSISTLLVIDQTAGVASNGNLNALAAAKKLGFPITCLVAGTASQVESASAQIMKYPGIQKIMACSGDIYAHGLAEPHADLICSYSKGFSHIVAASSPYSKNVFPRAAAIMNISPITDVIKI